MKFNEIKFDLWMLESDAAILSGIASVEALPSSLKYKHKQTIHKMFFDFLLNMIISVSSGI